MFEYITIAVALLIAILFVFIYKKLTPELPNDPRNEGEFTRLILLSPTKALGSPRTLTPTKKVSSPAETVEGLSPAALKLRAARIAGEKAMMSSHQ